jgi:hypothetical protein
MDKVVYQLSDQDIQKVALDILGRELSVQEIALIEDRIAGKISWYEAIAESLDECVIENGH